MNVGILRCFQNKNEIKKHKSQIMQKKYFLFRKFRNSIYHIFHFTYNLRYNVEHFNQFFKIFVYFFALTTQNISKGTPYL